MMIDDQLLELIVCPDNKQTLSLADEETIEKANRSIAASTLHFVSGALITERIDQLLIRADGQIGYGVYAGIPSLLIEEGILISKLDS